MAHQSDQVLGHLDVGLLVRPPNVVDLAGHAAVQDHLEGAGDVLHLVRKEGGREGGKEGEDGTYWRKMRTRRRRREGEHLRRGSYGCSGRSRAG